MSKIDQKVCIMKQQQIQRSMQLLAEKSTRENQRLEALRCSWTAGLTARVIETNWNTHYDAECGAIVEFDRIRIPLSKVETKKKSFRRAIYIIGNIGHQVQDSDIFTIDKEVTDIVVPNKLLFENVAHDFKLEINIFGMELAVKEKLKTIDPKAKFILWAKIVLGGKDMTNSTQRKNLQVSPSAPKLHNFYGAIDFKLSGAIPALCEVVKEGFLQLWTENDNQWQFVIVKLQNGKLRATSPDGKKNITTIEMTNQLKIADSSRRRNYAFQLRDFNGRTIFAASNTSEMNQWMQALRKHKQHLKTWGRIDTYNEPDTDEHVDAESPWSAFFSRETKVTVIKTGQKLNKNKRRSRSVDISTPKRTEEKIVPKYRRRSNSKDTPDRTRDWMKGQNKVMPKITVQNLPPRYDPPTICLDDSRTEQNVVDESLNDLLDNIDDFRTPSFCGEIDGGKRRDTVFMHNQIKMQTAKLAAQKTRGREPLRTSTQINHQPESVRTKYSNPASPKIDPISPVMRPVQERVKIVHFGSSPHKAEIHHAPKYSNSPSPEINPISPGMRPMQERVKRVQFGSSPHKAEIKQAPNVQFHDSINIDSNQGYRIRRDIDLSPQKSPKKYISRTPLSYDEAESDERIRNPKPRTTPMPRFSHLEF